ncbi:MAG TPA: MsnO8 family LLM class oxidoreductase, partial [Salinimicrobium sp.]|nr:MsnO8 family LLM class oxidoreductase [Salinimicrobium sp.]
MKKQTLDDIEFSVLDLVPVTKGNPIEMSFRNSIELAQKTEEWDFKRFWISEHHNMESIASSATVILISSIAGNTSRIRVGSGGIMLPNHSPLIVAEQFGTLETMFPGRIDLGLGRAPG